MMTETPAVDFTGCGWWWPEGLDPQPDQFADFACDFELSAGAREAWMALSCGTWATLWVNGARIWHGPPREVAPWQYYDVVDLQPHLVEGLNRLRVRGYHLGVTTQFHQPCLAGILVQGRVVSPEAELDLSDRRRWRAAPSPAFRPGAARLFSCLGFGEYVDLREDPKAWLGQPAPALWRPPACVADHPLAGRERLIARDLPPPAGGIRRAHWIQDRPGWQVWDFGEEVFGFLRAEVESRGGGCCTLLHGESLLASGLPDHRFSGGDFRETLLLPAGRRHWESFEKRALRYLAVSEGFQLHRLEVREELRPLMEVWRARPEAAHLEAEEKAIVAAAARTIQLNCDDMLTDCPRRERSQYNDPSVYMAAFPLLFGTWAPVRRWLRQYCRGAGPDGVLRMCYPSPSGHGVIPDFSLSFAENIARYGHASGDWETVRVCYDSAVAAVEGFRPHEDPQGLLADLPGWVFLCNSFEVAKHPRSSALNAVYAASWKYLAELAARFGDPRADAFSAHHLARRRAWRSVFLQDGRLLCADSSPQHEKRRWWNYHFEADQGSFSDPQGDPPPPRVLKVEPDGPSPRLHLAANGPIKVWQGGRLLAELAPRQPWFRPPVFHPWSVEIPQGSLGQAVLLEVDHNRIDWEVYFEWEAASPGECRVGQRTDGVPAEQVPLDRVVHPRPWTAPLHSQISVGYAAALGMLETEEARALLRSCLRESYHVPWMKRTTPIIAQPVADPCLIHHRAVLCNTPQSLYFFCRALRHYGMKTEARSLCRRIFGAMLRAGASTLWEEFAPRSSLCHAWSAFCVEHLLESGPEPGLPLDL